MRRAPSSALHLTRTLRRTLAAAGAMLAAWGCGPASPPPELPPQQAPPGAQEVQNGPGGAATEAKPPDSPKRGFDKEHPVLRCGPADSYKYVANYRCSDGSKPLQGDLRAGQSARVGNVGQNHAKHIIDHYLVPCPDGDAHVFVDMYGCPEWASRLGGP